MPLRGGESVGQAYVRIYADGSEVPDDIRRSIEEAEPSVREAGKEHGRTYGEEFDKESRKTFKTQFGDTKKSMFHDLNEGLTESIAKIELGKRFFGGPEWKKFLRRLDDEFGDAGKLAGRRLEAEFRDSADLSSITERMRQVGKDVRRAQADIIASLHDDAIAENVAFNARLRAQKKEEDLAFRSSVRDNQAAIVQFRNNMRRLSAEIAKLDKGGSAFGHRRLEQMVNDLRNLAPHLNATPHQLDLFNDRLAVMHRRLDEISPRIAAFDRHIVRLGDHMGRLFGKGSRNDFLNFFGSFVQMLTQAPRLITALISPFVKLGRSMSEAFTDAGGGARGTLAAFVKGLTGVAGVAAQAGAAVVAFAVFIGFLGIVLGPVVAILSGLVGILLALASSLIFAASSLAAFFPLVVPLAAIIAGVVGAVMDLNGAVGALGKTMNDISDKSLRLWENFKSGVGDSKGLGLVLDEVNRALSRMDPLVEAAIKGFNRFAGQIAEEMQGGAFDKFIDRFTRFLPHAMADLGTIFGNVFGGLTGLLRGAVPSANRLLDWLVKITDQFDKWANSKKGQREIKDFLDRAADSAESVGDFLEGAWHWLTKLVDRSKGEGDTLWERIGGQFQEWADWIDKHPDAFKQWMKDADDLAGSIGDVVDGLNELIDTLDSPRNRSWGNNLVSGLGTAFSALAHLIDFVNSVASKIWWVVGGEWVGDLFRGITDALNSGGNSGFWTAISQWGDGVQSRLSQLGQDIWFVIGGRWVGDLVRGIGAGLEAAGGAIASAVQNAISGLGRAFSGGGGGLLMIRPQFDGSAIIRGIARLPGMIARGLDTAVGAFRGLAGRAAAAAGDIAGRLLARFSPIPGRVAGVVDQTISRFGNVAERIARTIGDIWGQIASRFTEIPGHVATVIDAIVRAFAGLAGRILAMIGPIVIHPTIGSITGGGGAAKHPPASDTPPPPPPGTHGRTSLTGDPALRLVTATGPTTLTSGTAGKIVDASGWQIVTPSENPRTVATEVVNELIARAV